MRLIIGVALLAVAACSSRDATTDLESSSRIGGRPEAVEFSQAPAGRAQIPLLRQAGGRPRIVVLGDSLTAGLGLPRDQAYPAVLQRRVDAAGVSYEVVNAGVSGDTSADGLQRFDWAVQGDVRVLILALGANDGLRGLPPPQLRRNLAQMVERAQARGTSVILAGMEAPPNFGRDYFVEFHDVYPQLAKQYGVALVPFLLEGVAGLASLNQSDGIHPTAAGARIVADNVWRTLAPILEKTGSRGRGTAVPGS